MSSTTTSAVPFGSEARSGWSRARSARLKATELLPEVALARTLEGARFFDEGKYWEAHEAWEAVWRSMGAGVARSHLQALIQACGAFHLLSIGRGDAAARLARSSLTKLGPEGQAPEIRGLASVLEALGASSPGALEAARGLRVRTCAGD